MPGYLGGEGYVCLLVHRGGFVKGIFGAFGRLYG